MGGRRWGRRGRAYGVVVTPSCLKRAGLSRKVRNAGQRDAQLYPPIRFCAPPLLSHFPAWAGRRAGARCEAACVCVTATRDHWVCIINNEGALKNKTRRRPSCR